MLSESLRPSSPPPTDPFPPCVAPGAGRQTGGCVCVPALRCSQSVCRRCAVQLMLSTTVIFLRRVVPVVVGACAKCAAPLTSRDLWRALWHESSEDSDSDQWPAIAAPDSETIIRTWWCRPCKLLQLRACVSGLHILHRLSGRPARARVSGKMKRDPISQSGLIKECGFENLPHFLQASPKSDQGVIAVPVFIPTVGW